MKLKDLLKGRDKLRKYDELKKWKGRLSFIGARIVTKDREVLGEARIFDIPIEIKKIIIDAIDAEIKKMEEE